MNLVFRITSFRWLLFMAFQSILFTRLWPVERTRQIFRAVLWFFFCCRCVDQMSWNYLVAIEKRFVWWRYRLSFYIGEHMCDICYSRVRRRYFMHFYTALSKWYGTAAGKVYHFSWYLHIFFFFLLPRCKLIKSTMLWNFYIRQKLLWVDRFYRNFLFSTWANIKWSSKWHRRRYWKYRRMLRSEVSLTFIWMVLR